MVRTEDQVYKRGKLGLPLNLKELAGLPMLDGRISMQEALARRRKLQKEFQASVDIERALSQQAMTEPANEPVQNPSRRKRGKSS